jgi:hypothetical protein
MPSSRSCSRSTIVIAVSRTYLVQIDDFKGKNEPVTEVVEGVPRLKDEHGARQPGAPTGDEV